MTNVTSQLIEAIYDATAMMRLFGQRLSEGRVDDTEAAEMSWLLGSAKKRLEPVIDFLETIETQHEEADAPGTARARRVPGSAT